VQKLAETLGDRNAATQYDNLLASADYIEGVFSNAGFAVQRQEYVPGHSAARGRSCVNLIAELPGTVSPAEIVVVGAHYDSVMGCPGANDNASGVAALLELARAQAGRPAPRTLRFVAFANEEPPFFWTSDMGSAVYAARCRARNEKIVAMLSLETLGYYSDAPHSQRYPSPLFGWFLPTTGNFIGFTGSLSARALVHQTVGSFRRHAAFPSQGAALPGAISGVEWSDNWSFSRQGYPALMVTDTAPFRYSYYHTPQDTPDKLEYDRFACVVSTLEKVIGDLTVK
jgi:Zn-dependent M28 family amino/carboxypeptidase